MKNTKKILALLVSLMILVSSAAVFAESAEFTEEPISVEAVNLGDFIGNKEDWGVGGGLELTFAGGKIINQNEGLALVAYLKDSFSNKLAQYKMRFSFEKPDGSAAWCGFALRSKKCGILSWSGNNGYLVVIKNDRIELQRWSDDGQKILSVVPNELIKNNETANISAGAVNIGSGVNIFMFIDGIPVLNVYDTDDHAITEGEYFNIYASSGSEISAFDGDVIGSIPSAVTVKGRAVEGEKYTASYSVVSFGEDTDDEEYKISWYYSQSVTGEDLTELDQSAKDEFGSKFTPLGIYTDLAYEGSEYTVKADEIGGYYRVFVKDAEGNIVAQSTPVIVNMTDHIISNSVTLLVDCEMAYVKGKKMQIDPDDYSVMPGIIDGRTLVPVRFVAESLGAQVGWDDATRTITITLGEETIVMTLDSKDYTVNGEALQLDVPAQVMSERTMVPVRVVSEAFGRTVFWDAENTLIIISDEDLGLDSEKDAKSLAYLFEKIQERL